MAWGSSSLPTGTSTMGTGPGTCTTGRASLNGRRRAPST
jgi:hypothetical protein